MTRRILTLLAFLCLASTAHSQTIIYPNATPNTLNCVQTGSNTQTCYPAKQGFVTTVVAGLKAYQFTSPTVVQVKDGSSSTDCSTGGGSTAVVCQWNGTSWSALSSGGSSGTPGGSINELQYYAPGPAFGGTTSTYNSTTGDVFLAGQSPFTDALSATVGMVCDGSTDDTTAFQTWLNTNNTSGYAQLFIPYTGHLCYIAGYESSFSSSSIGNCGSPSVTCLTFSPSASVPTWVVVGAPIQLWGMGTSLTGCSTGANSSTVAGCNGVGYVQSVTTGSGGSITVWFGVSPGGTAPSSGSFSIGPWINSNQTIEGECTTNQSGNTSCSGLSTFKSGTSNAEVALTYAPCLTANPMNMTCPTSAHNPGARVEHLNIHGDGTALGGLYTSTLNGGLIADNTVFGFTGSVGNGAFPAFAFALDGIQSNEQNVKFTNNKGFNVERGFLYIGSNSGNEFNLNHFVCGNPTPIIASSVAYDLGWWWMTNTSASSTGGENTVSALQTENCEGGVWFDGQNEDRLFGKATEITSGGQASDTSSIVVSVQNSNSMQLFFDDKTGCTGYYQDAASTGILVFMTVSTSSIHSGCSSPNTGNGASFTNASNVLASGYDVATSEYHFVQAQSSGATLAKGDYFPAVFLNTALGATSGGTGLSSITASECLQGNSGGTAIVYGSCGSGSSVTLETNATNNASQTTLNLTNGSAVSGLTPTVTNTSGGTVQFTLAGTLAVACGSLPALTGDATTSAGSCGTTVGNLSGVTNGSLANSGLAHSAITIAGTSVSLGGSTSSLPSPGAIGGGTAAAGSFTTLTGTTINTTTHCAAAGSAASPSVASCSAAAAGLFSCATNASGATCVVDTTAVTANSTILVQPDASVGTPLSVTCNTTADTGLTAPRLASRSSGTSFTINLGTFSTNPLCFTYVVIN